jgi:hypothetical protein
MPLVGKAWQNYFRIADIRTFPAHRAPLISMHALMNFKEREGWSFHIV